MERALRCILIVLLLRKKRCGMRKEADRQVTRVDREFSHLKR
jgi:hypothetical protein